MDAGDVRVMVCRDAARDHRTVQVMASADTAPSEGSSSTRGVLSMLFGAVAARLRRAPEDEAAVIAMALDDHRPEEILYAAVASVAEAFRSIADRRDLCPLQLARILDDAYAELADGVSHIGQQFGALLAAVRAHLGDDTDAVDEAVADTIACSGSDGDRDAVTSAITFVAAALTWRASDSGLDGRSFTEALCLSAAMLDS